MIEAGWHRLASHPLHWSLASDPDRPAPLLYSPYGEHSFDTGPGLHHAGTAPWLKFGYPMQEQPGRLTVRRRFDLDVSDQREILAKLVWDRDTLLTVTATVDDGRTIFLCRDLEPDELWRTIGAPLDGARRLHHIDIDIREIPGRRVQSREVLVSLFWILLRRDSVLDRQPLNQVDVRLVRAHENHPDTVPTARRTVRQVPYHEPAESTTPIGDPLRDGLPFGFLVGRDALPALRQRVAAGPAAALFARIRAEADRALATDLVDRNYYGTPYGGGIGQPKGVMGGGMRLFAPTVALAHLLTGEARYAVAVRRWLLRAAHAGDWRGDHGGCVSRPNIGDRLWYWDSFTGWYPRGFAGYMNHPFMVADVAFGVVVAYDMVYHALDDRERATDRGRLRAPWCLPAGRQTAAAPRLLRGDEPGDPVRPAAADDDRLPARPRSGLRTAVCVDAAVPGRVRAPAVERRGSVRRGAGVRRRHPAGAGGGAADPRRLHRRGHRRNPSPLRPQRHALHPARALHLGQSGVGASPALPGAVGRQRLQLGVGRGLRVLRRRPGRPGRRAVLAGVVRGLAARDR